MAPLNWATYLERAVGKGHPTLPQTIDRALRQLLSESGYDPDAAIFPGLAGPVANVRAYGAIGDGATDDTAAIQAAITAANVATSGLVYFPQGAYKLTSPLIIAANGSTSGLCCRGTGIFGARLRKYHTGDLFQISRDFVLFDQMHLEGADDADPNFALNGAGIHFTPASAAYGFQMQGGAIYHIDRIIEGEIDTAHNSHYDGCYYLPYTVTPGSEPDAIWLKGDTSGGFHRFNSIFFPGKFKMEGVLDVQIVGSSIRVIGTDAASSIVLVQACILANNSQPQTVFGANVHIQGCRISGSLTLGAASTGTWIGNMFTSGVLTDNSGDPNNWNIYHRPEDSNKTLLIMPHTMRTKTAGIVATHRITIRGDVDASLTFGDDEEQYFNTPLTTTRSVTLNTPGQMKNGDRFVITRSAAATGASPLNVGSGPLKALAVGQWCIVQYDGSTWRLMAFGSL